MCRVGSSQDFHGIGVTNIIFGLLCVILPDHTLYNLDSNFFQSYSNAVDLTCGAGVMTIINGICFLAAGIFGVILARRIVENSSVDAVTKAMLLSSLVVLLLCPITFILNLLTTLDFTNENPARVSGLSDDTLNTPDNTDNSTETDSATKYSELVVVSLFMFRNRYMEYRYGASAILTLVAVGGFFTNISLICIAMYKRGYRYFGRNSNSASTISNVDMQIAYQNGAVPDLQDPSVVIQPLPSRPGPVQWTG